MDETNVETKQENVATAATETQATETKTETTPKTFTQEQVNEIVRERLERTYKGYGANSKEELDALFESSKKNGKELAFLKNNVNPSREGDIDAYFKGKGIDFNGENLAKELSTHPEWLNQAKAEEERTTIKVLGSDGRTPIPQASEKDEAAKLFGFKKFAE